MSSRGTRRAQQMRSDADYSADNRFVRGPYHKFAHPYDVYYPDRTEPGGRPYIYRHYIPPTYHELWDYHKQDNAEAVYNEELRQRLLAELSGN
jgi:hypothetical protein